MIGIGEQKVIRMAGTKHSHTTKNPFGNDEDVSLSGLDLTNLSLDNLFKNLPEQFGINPTDIIGLMAAREAGLIAAEKLLTPAADKLIDLTIDALGKNGTITVGNVSLEKESAKAFAKGGVTNVAIGAESLIRIVNTLKRDGTLRKELHAELTDYAQAGEKGIGATSFFQAGKHPNAVLEVAEHRIEGQFNQSATQAVMALIGSYGQYKAKQLDKNGLSEKVTELEALPTLNKADTRQLEELKKLISSDGTRNIANILADDKGQGFSGRINQANVVAVGSAVVSNHFMKGRTEQRKEIANTLIAYDLIKYLDNFLEKEDMKDGKIDIGGLKKQFKGHSFHALDNNKNVVDLHEFIGEIFNQHVRDQGAEKISGRMSEQLATASKKLADSITGKEYDPMTGASMLPIALIKLVGEGNIVSHDGMHVANESTVGNILKETREQFPNITPVDAAQYLADLARPVDELSDTFDDLFDKNAKMADFMLLILPASVVKEKLDSFQLSEKEIKTSKSRAQENALDTMKAVVADLTSLSDAELSEHQMLSKKQIALLRSTEKHIAAGEDDKVLIDMQESGVDGLRFAILSAAGYWQDLANGKEVGALSHPKPKECVMPEEHHEKKEGGILGALHDGAEKLKETANNIVPFHHKDHANDDHAKPDPKVTEPTSNGKVKEQELAAAR
jgi:hypothetical protein